ncbi:MAG: hypothetical protein K0U45_09125 [Alphaproteobacteria bacterium]|nr:hypothetical protein [Alphaproteobacteria bacterium]
MKKQTHIPSKISALLFFIASFASPANQVNAQEIGADKSNILEISTSLAHIAYADPETWNNSISYSLALRLINQSDDNDNFFVDVEIVQFDIGGTNDNNSPIDGLTRNSLYKKIGAGSIFNKTRAETTFFLAFGVGVITFKHYIEGVAAWRYPESNKRYHHRIIYEAETGAYMHVEVGFKIQNRHKLSFYITPVLEGRLTASNASDYRTDPDPFEQNSTPYNHQVNPYPYASIPDKIINGMAGFRYSYVFASF